MVDFLCIEAKLIVELDGGQHEEAADAPRTRFLEEQGYSVLRFWNNDVLENFEGIVETISTHLKKRSSPQPSPACGRGSSGGT